MLASLGGKQRATRKRTRKRVVPRKDKQPNPGPSQCHPSLGHVVPGHGCLPIDVLQRAIKKLHLTVNSSADGATLRRAIEAHLDLKKPGGERTFLNALPLSHHEKSELGKRYLRPPAPKEWTEDPDMWLDTNNIADVMNQYEEARNKNGVKEFEFMGPFPIDFAAADPYKKGPGGEKKCLMNEVCEIRVQKALENGTKSIGIVYNLDPHYKSGSHWVANYIDLAGHTCYYFDSYGMKPPPQIETFMKWLSAQDPSMKLRSNARRLQYSNTECGMYCIYMIIRMLEGDEFLQITRRKPKDADMLDFRDWIFST
jgi:hypothetical protein